MIEYQSDFSLKKQRRLEAKTFTNHKKITNRIFWNFQRNNKRLFWLLFLSEKEKQLPASIQLTEKNFNKDKGCVSRFWN